MFLLRAVTSLILVLTTIVASASTSPAVDSLRLERLHISTDRGHYDAGERVWMRVFMTDATTRQPVVQSHYVYVELIDTTATVHKRVMLCENDSVYCGHMDLPHELTGTRYMLRAYTMAIANVPALECIVPLNIGKGTCNGMAANTVPAHYTPRVHSTHHGDSTIVNIVLPDDCVLEQSAMSIAVNTDNSPNPTTIVHSMERDVPAGTRLISQPQNHQIIKGTVTQINGSRLYEAATVTLMSPEANFILSTTTDQTGQFTFDNLELADSTLLFMQAVDKYGIGDYILNVDSPSFPPCLYLDYKGNVKKDYVIDETPFIDDKTIMLDNITVTARRHEFETRDPISMLADQTLSLRRIKEIDPSSITDLFFRIAGVKLNNDGSISMRGMHSIYGDNKAKIAIDGVIMDDFDVNTIPIQDVMQVDVFRGGSALIWGADGGGGVISIYTKNGGTFFDKRPKSHNIKKVFPFGYQQHVPFAPSAGSATLYWNPAVKTQGNKVLTFSFPANQAAYITIEGVTHKGHTIYHHSKL